MAKNLKRQQRLYVLLSFPNKKSKTEIIRAIKTSRSQESSKNLNRNSETVKTIYLKLFLKFTAFRL